MAKFISGSEPVARVYDDLAPRYDAAFRRRLHEAEDRAVFEWLPRREMGERVLDLGSGTGLYLDYSGWMAPTDYLGLDISAGMVAKARTKFPRHRFVVGDMADLSVLADDSVDHIVSLFGSFSYVLQPARAVREMWRVLSPGGTINVMLLGRRYEWRKAHIANGRAAHILYSADDARDRFSPRFEDVKVEGLTVLTDPLPEWTPARLANWLVDAERRTLGRLLPDAGYSLLVSGRKAA